MNVIGQELQTLIIGDTVSLNVTGANGTLQWQESEDSLNWANINGATSNQYELITTSSTTGKRFIRAAITNDSICLDSAWYSSILRYKIISNTADVVVGDWYHGGIVFYTDGADNGLIAPLQNQGYSHDWGCYGTSIPGAKSMIDGAANTAAIVLFHDTLPDFYSNPGQCHGLNNGTVAAGVCDTISINGYNDWFLPAKDQLDLLFSQKNLVGGFTSTNFWSSTEFTIGSAWVQQFNTGSQYGISKYSGYKVRCIRSFSDSGNLSKIHSYALVTDQPVSVEISSQPNEQTICLGSNVNFSVTASGTEPYSYQWKKDGTDISGANANTFFINGLDISDEAIYTCNVANYCRDIITDNAELKVIEIISNAGADVRICSSQSAQLQATASSNHPIASGIINYSWIPISDLDSSNISNPNASPLLTETYTVNVIDQIGCTANDEIEIIVGNVFQDEELCFVTVDSSESKNKIVWEETSNVGTASFNIYKEGVPTNWNFIGNVLIDEENVFIDYLSEPENNSDSYKITAVDTCNSESELSFYHKTMNLNLSNVGSTMTLDWNAYVDESEAFIPDKYYIYRGANISNIALYDSISATLTSWNDININEVYFYKVGVRKSSGCDIGESMYTIAFSNQKDNEDIIIGLREQKSSHDKIKIYPNPAKTNVIIEGLQDGLIEIINVQGQVIRNVDVSNTITIIDISRLLNGIYKIRIITKGGIKVEEFIKD